MTELTDDLNNIAAIEEIEALRDNIDFLDELIIALFNRRTALAKNIVDIRLKHGGTRIVTAREAEIYKRYKAVGEEGNQLAALVLHAARGTLVPSAKV